MSIRKEIECRLCDADMRFDAYESDCRGCGSGEVLLDGWNPHRECSFVDMLNCAREIELGTGRA